MNPQLISLLFQMYRATCEAIDEDDQLFLSANYHKADEFFRSGPGKEAIREFILAWRTAPDKKG